MAARRPDSDTYPRRSTRSNAVIEKARLGRGRRSSQPGVGDMVHGVTDRFKPSDGGTAGAMTWAGHGSRSAPARAGPPRQRSGPPAPPAAPADFRLGTVRRSMQDNPLIKTAGHGRSGARRRVERMAHGQASGVSEGGVAACMSGGAGQGRARTAPARASAAGGQDYVELNRRSLAHGLVTAKEQARFREVYSVARKTKSRGAQPGRSRKPSVASSMTHGVPSKTDSGAAKLITMRYRQEWLDNAAQQQRRATEVQARGPIQTYGPNGIVYTRTQYLRQKHPEPEAKPLWKLRKFTSKATQPVVDTWRTEGHRRTALNAAATDGVSRYGAFSHGVYARTDGMARTAAY